MPMDADSEVSARLGALDKAFPLLIIGTMVAGLLLGRARLGVDDVLEALVPFGLFLMIYPTVTKVPLEGLHKAVKDKRPVGASIFLNYVVNPLLLYALGWIFLRNYPALWTGLILLGIAPCIGMVLVWADLGGADNSLSVALMTWNSLIQIVSVPFWILVLVGTRIPLQVSTILWSTFLYLVLPLVAGTVTRQATYRAKGASWFEKRLVPVLGRLQLTALLGTLIAMFALEGDAILAQPWLVALMALPLLLFFFTLFNVGYWVSRLLKLRRDRAVTVGFHVTGRNFELSIAIALSAFAATPLVPVSTVVGPLIEVPTMLTLVWLARRLRTRLIATSVTSKAAVPEIISNGEVNT